LVPAEEVPVLRKILFAFSALLIGILIASAQQNSQAPAEYKIPPEAANQANPVKPTPESLAKGKKFFGYDCAVCHGKDGDGKGDMTDLKGITDLTDPATLKGKTDGELFYVIKKGKGDMPPEGDRGKPEDLWNLVNYVRSLSKKK
jgi:mono/diheme cytochrome c family protein